MFGGILSVFVKMKQLKKLNELCTRKNIVVEIVKPPPYIEPFNVDSDSIILIRKEGTLPIPFTPVIGVKHEEEEEFDLTGSPLHTSLDDSLINLPLDRIQMKTNECYNHIPLTYSEAMHIINGYTTSGNPTFIEEELPIWVFCSPENHANTALILLWREKNGWVTRGRACITSSLPENQDGFPSLEAMVQKHLQLSKGDKDDVKYLVKACYIHDKGLSTDEFSRNDTELKMHFSWTRPYTFFSRPPYDATSNLEINIVVGSEATQIWQEIETLKEIGILLEITPEEKEVKLMESMSTRNFTSLNSEMRSKIQFFIANGALPGAKDNHANEVMSNGILHLNQIYEEVTKGRKSDADLTEILWSVLKDCSDPVESTSCFKLIFREAAAGRLQTMFLPDNHTTLAKVIQGFMQRSNLRSVPPRLKKSDGLILLFELGCLKIQRDYKQIFKRIDINAHHFGQICEKLKFIPAISSANRQKCLENIVDVHSLLEVLMLLRSRLHLEEDSLHMLATSAMTTLLSSEYVVPKSPRNSHSDSISDELSLQRNLSLSLPIHQKLLIPLVKGLIPNSWSVCLSMSDETRRVKTIFYTANEIFPSTEHEADLTITDKSDNQMVQFTLLSDKLFSNN